MSRLAHLYVGVALVVATFVPGLAKRLTFDAESKPWREYFGIDAIRGAIA